MRFKHHWLNQRASQFHLGGIDRMKQGAYTGLVNEDVRCKRAFFLQETKFYQIKFTVLPVAETLKPRGFKRVGSGGTV